MVVHLDALTCEFGRSGSAAGQDYRTSPTRVNPTQLSNQINLHVFYPDAIFNGLINEAFTLLSEREQTSCWLDALLGGSVVEKGVDPLLHLDAKVGP